MDWVIGGGGVDCAACCAKVASEEGVSALLTAIQRRLQPVLWLCLAVLAATGMFQMSANSHYGGFLEINSPWAVAILLKHVTIGVMVVVAAAQTGWLLPALQRNAQKMALLRAKGNILSAERGAAQLRKGQRLETALLWVNLALSVVVLILTAWARAS